MPPDCTELDESDEHCEIERRRHTRLGAASAFAATSSCAMAMSSGAERECLIM